MNNLRTTFKRRSTQVSLAIVAAAALVGGVACGGVGSAEAQSTAERATSAQAPTIAHAVAGARDSYADIVKIVAPAVVTVRADGKSRISQTDFQAPDDE